MTRREMIEKGRRAAIIGGSSENEQPDDSPITDAVANLRHYAVHRGFDWDNITASADSHYWDESDYDLDEETG